MMTLLEAYQIYEKNPITTPFLCRDNFKHGRMAVVEDENGSLVMHCPKCHWGMLVPKGSIAGARMVIMARSIQTQIALKEICPSCMWVTNATRTCRHPFHQTDAKRATPIFRPTGAERKPPRPARRKKAS